MLAIILGSLAGVFLIVLIVLIVYILRKKWRKRVYRKHVVGGLFFQVRNPSQKSNVRDPMFDDVIDAFDVTRHGSMRETGKKRNSHRKSSCKLYSLDKAIVPFTDTRKLPDLPYDPNYTEVYFAASEDQDGVSLSSHSGSDGSDYENFTQAKDASHGVNKTLLDPDTGVVPVAEH